MKSQILSILRTLTILIYAHSTNAMPATEMPISNETEVCRLSFTTINFPKNSVFLEEYAKYGIIPGDTFLSSIKYIPKIDAENGKILEDTNVFLPIYVKQANKKSVEDQVIICNTKMKIDLQVIGIFSMEEYAKNKILYSDISEKISNENKKLLANDFSASENVVKYLHFLTLSLENLNADDMKKNIQDDKNTKQLTANLEFEILKYYATLNKFSQISRATNNYEKTIKILYRKHEKEINGYRVYAIPENIYNAAHILPEKLMEKILRNFTFLELTSPAYGKLPIGKWAIFVDKDFAYGKIATLLKSSAIQTTPLEINFSSPDVLQLKIIMQNAN